MTRREYVVPLGRSVSQFVLTTVHWQTLSTFICLATSVFTVMGVTHGNNGLEQGNIKHNCLMMGRVPELASAFIFTSLSTFVTTTAPHVRYPTTVASAEGLQGRRRRWHRPTQADANDRRGSVLYGPDQGPDRPHVLLLSTGSVFRRLLMPSEARLPESRDGRGENE